MRDLSTKFKDLFGKSPSVISTAPGRINLIGEHTDYNLGYVLPAAIDRRIYFLAAPRNDEKVKLWADNFGKMEEFALRDLSPSSENIWANYVKGIFWVLEKEGHSLGGVDGFIFGDIPLGSGLSSSAALEVSVTNALNVLFKLSLPVERIPQIAQKSENEYVGVECGLMDQFISVFGRRGQALFLDCETYVYEYIPLPLKNNGVQFIVVDSRVRRELSSSEYNTRRRECQAVVNLLKEEGVESLRDVPLRLLEDSRDRVGDLLFRRARHVITENERVVDSVHALKSYDFIRLGELLLASHRSLRDDYEVSCPELDLLYSLGEEYGGCLGARLTGAGFGGSGIALIENECVRGFQETIEEAFAFRGFKPPQILEIDIGEGAVVR